jgi:hypothetical protein
LRGDGGVALVSTHRKEKVKAMSDTLLKLKNVRLSFPELWAAKTVNGEGEPAFSASFILPPDHPQIAEIKKKIDAVGQAKWANKWPEIKRAMEKADKTALHDGDNKSYAGYPGNLFISARNKSRPAVFDRDKTPLTKEDGRPYGGCYVNANVELWAQDNAYGKRINASLSGVQFARDGEAFSGGRSSTADDFDDVSQTGDELV